MKSTRFAGRLLILVLVLAAVAALPLVALALDYTNVQGQIKDHSFGNGSSVEMTNNNIPQGKPGEAISLEVPLHIEFNYQDVYDAFHTIDLYTDSVVNDEYDPRIQQIFNHLSVELNTSNPDSLPFVVEAGENYFRRIVYEVNGNLVNDGFAAFDLTLREDAEAKSYVIPLIVEWTDYTGKTVRDTSHFRAVVTVQAKPTSSGSSGGGWSGGGGGGTEAATPQAKLMVASVQTIPEEPKAGETFEIVLMLRNTSESKYLQNVSMTYTAEEDLIMPVSGTNSVYIKRIDKGADHEVRLNVKAMPEVTGQPVKMELAFEFEDAKVTALTATQTIVLNVDQPIRIQVDDPVMPAVAPYAGDVVEFTLQVYNLGRPTVYNVMARVVSDNANLVQVQAGFGGQMETGTNKALEMEIIPQEAGEYTATVELSYEDADGEKFIETRAFTLFAMAIEEYDTDESWMNEPEEPEEPEEPAALLIMQSLPWWLYAAIGGILLLLILSMGIGARRRRRKDFEDDEMD